MFFVLTVPDSLARPLHICQTRPAKRRRRFELSLEALASTIGGTSGVTPEQIVQARAELDALGQRLEAARAIAKSPKWPLIAIQFPVCASPVMQVIEIT